MIWTNRHLIWVQIHAGGPSVVMILEVWATRVPHWCTAAWTQCCGVCRAIGWPLTAAVWMKWAWCVALRTVAVAVRARLPDSPM
eukprot:7230112-Prorocentrum_lima.AAC.1